MFDIWSKRMKNSAFTNFLINYYWAFAKNHKIMLIPIILENFMKYWTNDVKWWEFNWRKIKMKHKRLFCKHQINIYYEITTYLVSIYFIKLMDISLNSQLKNSSKLKILVIYCFTDFLQIQDGVISALCIVYTQPTAEQITVMNLIVSALLSWVR